MDRASISEFRGAGQVRNIWRLRLGEIYILAINLSAKKNLNLAIFITALRIKKFNVNLAIATFKLEKTVMIVGQNYIARAVARQTLITQRVRLKAYIRAVVNCLESVWNAR